MSERSLSYVMLGIIVVLYGEVSLGKADFVVLLCFILLLRSLGNENEGGRCGRPCGNCYYARKCWERLGSEVCFGGCGTENTLQRTRNKDEEKGWHMEHRRGKEGAGIKKTTKKNKENEQTKEEIEKTKGMNKGIEEERTRKKDKNGKLGTERKKRRQAKKEKRTIEEIETGRKTSIETIVEVIRSEIAKRKSKDLDDYLLQSQETPAVERANSGHIDKMAETGNGSQQTMAPTFMLDFAQLLAAQCPLPGQPGAPCFNGKEVTRFIRSWERFTEKYRITADRMVRDLVDYCDDSVLGYVETLIDDVERETNLGRVEGTTEKEASWAGVRALLLKTYKADDTEQQKNSVAYIQALTQDKAFRANVEDVERYIRTYQQISNTLMAEGRITAYDQIIMFLQGLPDQVSVKVIRDMKVDIETPSSFAGNEGFDTALTIALARNKERTDVDKLRGLRILSPETESALAPAKDQQPATTRILKNMKNGTTNGQGEREHTKKDEEKKQLKLQVETLAKEMEQLRLFN